MPKHSQTKEATFIFITRAFLWSALWSVISFPVKYYTVGLKTVANKIWHQILWLDHYFALSLSLKTLFTPLFGDYSREGRVAGFVVRVGLLFYRLFAYLVAVLLLVAGFLLYALLPIILIYLLIIDLSMWL